MAKQSAGLLLYRRTKNDIEVLLGHPGGPFWARKDKGVWSIPKGEFDDEEDKLAAAQREFTEELGKPVPAGTYEALGSTKLKSGKTIYAWAVEADIDVSNIVSNIFEVEWPPKSGEKQEFPEIDKAAWFKVAVARGKIHPAQAVFLDRLAEQLGLSLEPPEQMEQTSLFL